MNHLYLRKDRATEITSDNFIWTKNWLKNLSTATWQSANSSGECREDLRASGCTRNLGPNQNPETSSEFLLRFARDRSDWCSSGFPLRMQPRTASAFPERAPRVCCRRPETWFHQLSVLWFDHKMIDVVEMLYHSRHDLRNILLTSFIGWRRLIADASECFRKFIKAIDFYHWITIFYLKKFALSRTKENFCLNQSKMYLCQTVVFGIGVKRRQRSFGSDPAVDVDVLVLWSGVAKFGNVKVLTKFRNLKKNYIFSNLLQNEKIKNIKSLITLITKQIKATYRKE